MRVIIKNLVHKARYGFFRLRQDAWAGVRSAAAPLLRKTGFDKIAAWFFMARAGWLQDRAAPHMIVFGMGSIGDVVQITPVLRILKEKCPSATITVLHRSSAAKTVLRNNPNVTRVLYADFHHIAALKKAIAQNGLADLLIEIQSMSFLVTMTSAPEILRHADFKVAFPASYFAAVDVARQHWQSPRPVKKPDGKFTWQQEGQRLTYLDALGKLSNLPIDGQSKLDFLPDKGAAKILESLPKQYITVQSGVDRDVVNWARALGVRPTKLLPQQTWRDITQQLNRDFALVQLGASADEKIDGVAHDLRGKTSLSEAAVVLKNAFCHLGTEGGLAHLARAMETKAVILFGPTSHDFLGYPHNANLKAGDCGSCWGATQDWYIRCPRGLAQPECMAAHGADAVVQMVMKVN